MFTKKPKRYTLSLPVELSEELTALAEKHSTSSRDIVIKCLKLGSLALKLEGDDKLILREDDKDTILKIF